MNKLIQRSFLNALGTIAYITLIATIALNSEKLFKQSDSIIAPISVLTVFVLSAAITGSLILGKPILMFLNGSKSEAIKLFLYTLGWLFITLIIIALFNLK